MLDELPKTLPPRHDHKIDMEIRYNPPADAPYRMAIPELEKLRKKLKKLLKAGHIRYGAAILFQNKNDWSLR